MSAPHPASQYVDVVIKHVTDLEEVTVSVLESATIRDIKDALAEKVERPELVEVGEIVRVERDGSATPYKDQQKVLNTKRLLSFRGCPLHPPPPERPPLSLDDFADFDPDEEDVDSPRSLHACFLEGVAAEDLIYVPLDSYQESHIEPRIAELWYDFFEAVRQDCLKSCRATRQMLIAEEEGRFHKSGPSRGTAVARHGDSRIAGTGGNWCGALGHSKYDNVQQFFMERNEMCNVDRIYKGAVNPCKPSNRGSRYFSNSASFEDYDPVRASDNADDAADKLDKLLSYYDRLPNAKKFVEEQRLKTKATGIVQYAKDAEKLHRDQAELRRLIECRIETAKAQCELVDNDIQYRLDVRRDMEEQALESKPPKNKLEEIRMVEIKKRAEYFAERREQVHLDQLDAEQLRRERMQNMTLADQAIQERVHQHKSLRRLGFAREWAKRRVRWQINHNSVTQNRDQWNQATLDKQQNATDRVNTQHLIRQKWIEYRRELKSLKRVHADLAVKRENARQDARREAVASELARIAREEAVPSTSPIRRNLLSSGNLSSAALSLQSVGSASVMTGTAPFAPHLKQPRVVKRIARFDFPRMGSGFLASSPTASTHSGNWSLSGASTLRQSMSMPSVGN